MAELRALRCAVCMRILGRTADSKPKTTYCPDRLCHLYPTFPAASEPADLAFEMSVIEGGLASGYALKRAFDNRRNPVQEVSRMKAKWRTAG